MKRLLLAVAALCALAIPAHAQSTKAAQISQIASCFPDNTSGSITPAIIRTCLDSVVNSYQQFTGVNAQTGTSYPVATTDYGQLITFCNTNPVATSLPLGSAFFPFNTYVKNNCAGLVTITPQSPATINGAPTFTLAQNQSAYIVSDGGNWQVWNSTTVPNSFGTQSANTMFAGPTSGGAANPGFRLLVAADYQTATIPLASLQTQGADTVVCNATAGTASPTACSQAQITALINTVTASLPGLIPAFPNTTTSYFRGDGTYQTHNCASNSNAGPYCAATQGQLPGTTTNDSASSGNIGELISSSVARASPVSLTNTTPVNLTSIPLTAGDWDVMLTPTFTGTSTVATVFRASLSTTTGTEAATTPGAVVAVPGGTLASTDVGLGTISLRFSVSGPTTVFAVIRADFGSGAVSGWGLLQARRRR